MRSTSQVKYNQKHIKKLIQSKKLNLKYKNVFLGKILEFLLRLLLKKILSRNFVNVEHKIG